MTNEENQPKTVCVYCGASPSTGETYQNIARRTGTALANASYRVVYGGGRSGLMGIVADSALEAGGEVIGIIPGHIDQREVRHEELTELHVVDSMHVRKEMMAEKSDVFLILPGGLGTMDEFFEILTWRQIGLHDKPIVILNEEQYWTPLIDLIQNIKNAKFMKETDYEMFKVFDRLEDVMSYIKDVVPSKEEMKKGM